MKKIVKVGIALLMTAGLALSLAGCASKECDACGKKYSSGGKQIKNPLTGDVLMEICGDCAKEANDALNGLFD